MEPVTDVGARHPARMLLQRRPQLVGDGIAERVAVRPDGGPLVVVPQGDRSLNMSRTQAQTKSLSFGSVIDHMNPWDVESLRVTPVDDTTADRVEDAWRSFSDAQALLKNAEDLVESLLDT